MRVLLPLEAFVATENDISHRLMRLEDDRRLGAVSTRRSLFSSGGSKCSTARPIARSRRSVLGALSIEWRTSRARSLRLSMARSACAFASSRKRIGCLGDLASRVRSDYSGGAVMTLTIA